MVIKLIYFLLVFAINCFDLVIICMHVVIGNINNINYYCLLLLLLFIIIIVDKHKQIQI